MLALALRRTLELVLLRELAPFCSCGFAVEVSPSLVALCSRGEWWAVTGFVVAMKCLGLRFFA